MSIAALFTVARIWSQLRCPLTDEWIKKNVVHICNGILLRFKKKRTDFGLVRQMNLESVMQSEIRQNEKDRYHILTHIYGI